VGTSLVWKEEGAPRGGDPSQGKGKGVCYNLAGGYCSEAKCGMELRQARDQTMGLKW